MKEVCISIHQGIGDLFNSIGIINYYSDKYDKVYVYLLNNISLQIYNEIFKNKNNVIPIIHKFENYVNVKHPNTCFNCMTNGRIKSCYRNPNIQCKYVNYDNLKFDCVKIGSFNNAEKWENFRKKKFSFAHAFYEYANLDLNIRFSYFKLYNDKNKENKIYDNFIKKYGDKYILIHNDEKRYKNIIDENKFINKNIPVINLDKISDNFVDYLKVIKNAQEIHLIDSSWSVFIYLLSYNFIKNIPVFLNEKYFKSLGRDTNIYKNPTFSNWIFY